MRARLVTTLPELLALRPHWDRLLAVTDGATPWQDLDFIASWWPHMARAHALRVIVVERGGLPCMILPLQIARWPWLPLLPVRILEPIGSIMDVNRPRLALGPWDEAAFACALETVWSIRAQWHTLRVDEKLAEEVEVAALRRFAAARRLTFRQIFSHLCPWLDLRSGWEAFIAGRSAKLRKNLRAAHRRLAARGAVTLQDCRTPTDIAAALEVVTQLNARSWKRRARVEHGHSPAWQQFHRGWLMAMAARGAARILILRCAGEPVAATVACMDDRGTYYSAQIVHDAAYGDCSPGTLLESMELEGLMREARFHTYDMLGSFLSNKLRWTDTAHHTLLVFVTRPSLRGALFDAYYFRLKPKIRPWLLPLLRRIRRNRGVYADAAAAQARPRPTP